jgi:hypothetical protein
MGGLIMRRFGILSVAALALSVAASAVIAGTGVHFAYDIKEGQTESFKVKFNQETDLGFFLMSSFVDMEVTETCVNVDEDGYLMEMTFDKVEASRMFQDKMSQDPIAAALIGQKIAYRVNRHGDVTDLKAAGYIEGWGQVERIIKPMVESGYSYLPDAEIDEGGEWGKDGETEKTGEDLEVTTVSNFKFKEMKEQKGRNCAKIVGRLENTIAGTTFTPQGNMSADGKGKGKFEMYFDPATSVIVKLKASMDIKMDLTPERGDAVETTISYTLERELI